MWSPGKENYCREKMRVFSTACQELTSMERGLHNRTGPLPSYCSAGFCFWSASMCCQRRVFLNIVMNSATDSTAVDFQLPNGKLAWCHKVFSESDCSMKQCISHVPRKDSTQSAPWCSATCTKMRNFERCQREAEVIFCTRLFYLSLCLTYSAYQKADHTAPNWSQRNHWRLEKFYQGIHQWGDNGSEATLKI